MGTDVVKAGVDYQTWYADNVCRSIRYLGVPIIKNVLDLWNYQEIIVGMRPALVVEFGTSSGGSALFFAEVMRHANPDGLVVTVDVENQAYSQIHSHPLIKYWLSDSVAPEMKERLLELRKKYPGTVFAILDSEHKKGHVLAEMELLRDVLRSGDYLVVEDSCINGHPIYNGWGEGPYEALEEYHLRHPGDYTLDVEREAKFGFTFATAGYLRRV